MKPRIFQETWEKVWNGEKTVTSRPIKKDERILVDDLPTRVVHTTVYSYYAIDGMGQRGYFNGHRDRIEWEVGGTFLMKPSRTAPGIALLQVEAIEQADVLKVDEAWAAAEGFETIVGFVSTYVALNHPHYRFPYGMLDLIERKNDIHMKLGSLHCWKVRFSVVERYPDKLAKWQEQT